MGEEQIATILPVIQDIYRTSQLEELYCATFTTSSDLAPTIQLIPQALNICDWEFEQNPENEVQALLGDLLPNLRLTDWEPQTFAVFDFDAVCIMKQAQAIDLLFSRLAHGHHHYHLQVEEIYAIG